MQHTSSLFFGQRLCLEELKMQELDDSNEVIIFSGHGNTVEIYRVYSQSADEDFDKFELLSTLDIFSNTKSSVQKIIWLENDALFCVGERECQIVCLDRTDLKFLVKKRQNLYFDDWIIGAKCVDGTGIVLHFATNSIKLLDLSNFSNIQTKCQLYLKGRSVMLVF
ncbi:unnamed protein product [Meloidogyne enterolobii]|uniref:Uncharacterized protein n=1 Tax=Meloidogyne enterolobii TaxID=390850 RepID=A0ACB0Y536_MELEN